MRLQVRTADRINQTFVDLPPGLEQTTTGGELLQAVRENFKLPIDGEFFIRSERQGKQIDPTTTLAAAGIEDGDIVEVAPILQAGA